LEVVTDVRGLLEDDSIINDTATATFREYNTDQMVQVQSPGNQHYLCITKHGELSDGEYLDPRGNQVVFYDHIKQEVTGSRPAQGGEIDGSCEAQRSAFDNAYDIYVQEHFPNGTSTVYGKKSGGETILDACISSSKFNPQNYWNGRWRSHWTITLSGSQATCEGHVKINVHYYEDGNVQLNTDTNLSVAVRSTKPEDIVAAIKKAETKFAQSLGKNYDTMGDTTFKALRRKLPITVSKIDWAKIRNYRIGSDVSGN